MMGTWISGILVVLSEMKVRGLRGNNPIVSMLGHLWGIHRAGWDDAELYRSNPG